MCSSRDSVDHTFFRFNAFCNLRNPHFGHKPAVYTMVDKQQTSVPLDEAFVSTSMRMKKMCCRMLKYHCAFLRFLNKKCTRSVILVSIFKVQTRLFQQPWSCLKGFQFCFFVCFKMLGYLEKEIMRSEIDIPEAMENPDAPAPREMIDLEVCHHDLY